MHIILNQVSYTYQSPFADPHRALTDISLDIRPGELIGMVGESGSGKTTLIQHLNGLLLPSQGQVVVDSCDIADPDFDLTGLRRCVGLVFQFPENQIFEETVLSDVAFGPRNLGLTDHDVMGRVRRSLKLMGFSPDTIDSRSPFTLSGGEKRRVAIAGVLAMEPDMLVMDEPTVGLDTRSGDLVEDMIIQSHRRGATVLFISHDMDLVARLARRVIVLHNGCVIFDGPKSNLFSDQELLNTAGLHLPAVCDFMQELKKEGVDVRSEVYTVKAAKTELDRVMRCKS